jgi:hypothetical protein
MLDCDVREFIYDLLNDDVRDSYIVNSQSWFGKNVEETRHGLISGIIPVLAWSD